MCSAQFNFKHQVIMMGRKQMWYIKQGKYYSLVLLAGIELLPDVDLMMMAFPSCLLLLNADNSLPTFQLLPIVFLIPGPPWHPLAQYSLFSLSLYQLPVVRQEAKFVLVLQYHHVINNICCRCFCISKIDPVVLWNDKQMQLYAVNFIPLISSLYTFQAPHTPIIRSTTFNCIYSHWYKP